MARCTVSHRCLFSISSGILDNYLVFHSRMILIESLYYVADLLRLSVSMDTLHGCLHESWNRWANSPTRLKGVPLCGMPMANQQVDGASQMIVWHSLIHLGVMVDNAMNLIPRPSLSESRAREYFDLTMKDALAHGLTSIHDADSSPEAISLFRK
jgi:hypothetical protein